MAQCRTDDKIGDILERAFRIGATAMAIGVAVMGGYVGYSIFFGEDAGAPLRAERGDDCALAISAGRDRWPSGAEIYGAAIDAAAADGAVWAAGEPDRGVVRLESVSARRLVALGIAEGGRINGALIYRDAGGRRGVGDAFGFDLPLCGDGLDAETMVGAFSAGTNMGAGF